MSDDLPQRARERAGARGFPDADLLLDLARAIETLHSDNAKLREGLKWYAEKAEALCRKDPKSPGYGNYAEAIFVELRLDGGRRAKSLLDQDGRMPDWR